MSRANPQATIVSEEQLVPSANRLKITKNNQRVASDSNITDTLLKLVVGSLKHHKLYKPVSLTATLPMPLPDANKPYTKPPIEKQILAFIKTLGYDEDPKAKMTSVSTFVATKLRQPWRAIMSVLKKRLTGKNTSWDTARLPILQILCKFKFRMEIPDTMINDAIKQSAGYRYYKYKKNESEKAEAAEEPEEHHVSPVRSGKEKKMSITIADNLVLQEDVTVELAKSVSIEEQRLQQRKIMTQLTIERQVEKDVEDTYAVERGVKLKVHAIKDPAI
ncbi:hypothetical protein Tco_1206883 [Tanacetum coccineum]